MFGQFFEKSDICSYAFRDYSWKEE